MDGTQSINCQITARFVGQEWIEGEIMMMQFFKIEEVSDQIKQKDCPICSNYYWTVFEMSVYKHPKDHHVKPSFKWEYCPKCGKKIRREN